MPGVCVFDIDDTLTCGDPRPLVEACKRLGYSFAINTARPVADVKPVRFKDIGMPHDTPIWYNPDSYSQSAQQIAQHKASNMRHIQRAFGVDSPAQVVLIDDNADNIQAVQSQGFQAIHAPHTADQCGLSSHHAHLLR